MAVWQYDGDGGFVDFEKEACGRLEDGYKEQKGEGKLDMVVNDRPYTFNFTSFEQVNVDTNKRRKLRRMYNAPVWEWQAAHKWEPYSVLQNKNIEKAFQTSPDKPATFEVGQGAKLELDFTSLTQTNEYTSKTRKIRRTHVLSELPKDRHVDASGALRFFKRMRSEDEESEGEVRKDVAPPSLATWEWSDKASWKPFQGGLAEQLEKGLQSGKAKTMIAAAGINLSIDFNQMTQYNPATKGVRKIRRIDPHGAVAQPQAPKPTPNNKSPSKGPKNGPTVVDNWVQKGSVLVLPGNVKGGRIVVGLDLDDTIIKTKSGNVFPKSETDWQLLCLEVPAILKTWRAKQDVKIVVFSNQAGIAGRKAFDKKKAKDIQNKILAVSKALGMSVQAFVATANDGCRKPNTAMWDLMEKEHNGGVAVDRTASLYIGDAAGRAVTTLAGRGKDFSCSDRKFAHNLGVRFLTPEEFYKGASPVPFEWGGFNPTTATFPKTPTKDGRTSFHAPSQEVVIFVGPPGAGKTTFAKANLVKHGYVHVNRDTLNTQAKCMKVLQEALRAGKSAVVDNTNPKPETRREAVEQAKAAGVPIRCFVFAASDALAKHLNRMREATTNTRVPGIAYTMYNGNLKAPTAEEGFSEVLRIDFVPSFESPTHKKMFESFYSE